MFKYDYHMQLFFICVFLGSIAFTARADSWTTTGSMNVERRGHTATLLPGGKVLVAGGDYPKEDGWHGSSTAELYDPIKGIWSNTGSMVTMRTSHTATILPDGRVLIAGGQSGDDFSNNTPLATAELYDSKTGTWKPTGSMSTARVLHSSVLLPNGKVLVVGGYEDSGYHLPTTTELYDPATGTWSNTGSMHSGHNWFPSAILLPNGKVLVAGGADSRGEAIATAELYDPPTGDWININPMNEARADADQSSALLSNGKVLIAGGYATARGGEWLSTVEIYDPTTGIWSYTGSMNLGRAVHTTTFLSNGKVLAAGGFTFPTSTTTTAAELYNPSMGTWSNTSSMNTARGDHTITKLPNGTFLIAGGVTVNGTKTTATAEIYTPDSIIGGSVINTKLQTVICKNVTTGQSVTLKRLKGAASWDCTNAGLQAKTGDVIKGTYTGTVR